jgi:hypothetical protein
MTYLSKSNQNSGHQRGEFERPDTKRIELPFSLFLVRLVEEHCERDDQEHEHRVHDVHNVPQLLHGEG